MAYEVGTTDQFDEWFDDLSDGMQHRLLVNIGILREVGPTLGRPRVDTVYGSRYSNMKELRVQIGGDPYRVLFAFDPRRMAMLLIGGNKGGDDLFYDRMIPLADALYGEHLASLENDNG